MTLYMGILVIVLHDVTICVTMRVYYKKNELLAHRELCCSTFYCSVLCVFVCIFCFCPVSCVPNVASVSVLSILHCPFGFL